MAACDDALEAIGFVLLGSEAPVVVCAVDWAGLLNEAHLAWRRTLAAAADTTPERVAVQCVHQHTTPFVCPAAKAADARHPDLPPMYDPEFLGTCLTRADAAVRQALRQPRRVTHVAHGQAPITNVASNRRVSRDASGRIVAERWSACTDEALRSLPDGLIEPQPMIRMWWGAGMAGLVFFKTSPPARRHRDENANGGCSDPRRRDDETPRCDQTRLTAMLRFPARRFYVPGQ